MKIGGGTINVAEDWKFVLGGGGGVRKLEKEKGAPRYHGRLTTRYTEMSTVLELLSSS